MKKNMGSLDRVIRIILAITFGVLIYTGKVNGTIAMVLGVLGVVFLVTSIIQLCPLYLPFGLSTCKKPGT